MRRGRTWTGAWAVCAMALVPVGRTLAQDGTTEISRRPGAMAAGGFARARAAADAARADRDVTEEAPEEFGWGDRVIETVLEQVVDFLVFFIERLATRAGLGDLLSMDFDFNGDGVTGTGSDSNADQNTTSKASGTSWSAGTRWGDRD